MDKITEALIAAQGRYTPKRNRNHWYVDVDNGTDTNVRESGRVPDRAFATIVYSLSQMAAGDCLHISEGIYDEAVAIGAALSGIEVICEPGVIINNTTPGTVVTVSAPYVKWKGGIINQAGQTGLLISNEYFHGEDIVVDGCAIAYDINEAHAFFKRCVGVDYTTTGFDIAEPDAVLEKCTASGTAATRGFYLSHTNAHGCVVFLCNSLNNTAGGFETVAGADENMFVLCGQSSLCAGPTDAGANNTFVSHSQDSQITSGNTLQEDLDAIFERLENLYPSMDFWSDSQETLTIPAVAADQSLPDIVVSGLPTGAVVQRAILMFKYRKLEETSSGANALSGAQDMQIRDDTPGSWADAINFQDDQYTLAADEVQGGDVVIGDIDVSSTVDGNDTYNVQWDEAVADAASIVFTGCQVGVRIWYSVG